MFGLFRRSESEVETSILLKQVLTKLNAVLDGVGRGSGPARSDPIAAIASFLSSVRQSPSGSTAKELPREEGDGEG